MVNRCPVERSLEASFEVPGLSDSAAPPIFSKAGTHGFVIVKPWLSSNNGARVDAVLEQ